MNSFGKIIGFTIVLGAGTACKSATADAPKSAPTEVISADKFKDASKEQKIDYMKNVVMPKMGALFAKADAEMYGNADCTLCHGEAAKDGKFKMPNPTLPAINPADNFAAHMDKHAETVKFMMQEVVPKMAMLTGQQPYNPETQQGFGCFGCHTMAQPASQPATE